MAGIKLIRPSDLVIPAGGHHMHIFSISFNCLHTTSNPMSKTGSLCDRAMRVNLNTLVLFRQSPLHPFCYPYRHIRTGCDACENFLTLSHFVGFVGARSDDRVRWTLPPRAYFTRKMGERRLAKMPSHYPSADDGSTGQTGLTGNDDQENICICPVSEIC